MASSEQNTLEHFLKARLSQPQDASTRIDLSRPGGWCPINHPLDVPCPRPAFPDLHSTLALDTVPDIPTYLDTEVIVLHRFFANNIMKVIIPASGSDHEMVCKVALNTPSAWAVFREFQCLLLVAAAYPVRTRTTRTPPPRIPEILGIVRSPAHGGVIGLVETLIPHTVTHATETRFSRGGFQTLRGIDLTRIASHRREKWISQIQETMVALHRVGIAWSDAKDDNILINSETDDAWLIDFGGGRTDGWAKLNTIGSIEGDLVTMRKVVEYLELGEQYRLVTKLLFDS